MRRGAAFAWWAGALLLLSGQSCAPEEHPEGKPPSPPASAAPDPLAPLHAFEESRRAAADFARLPPSDRAFGPDPTAIRPLPGRGTARYLWLEQEGKCRVCDQALTLEEGWHVHHLLWRVHGGTDAIDNLVLLHPNCHRQVHSEGLVVNKDRVPQRAFAKARAGCGETRTSGS